MVTAQKTKLKS